MTKSRLQKLKEDERKIYYVYDGVDPEFEEFENLAHGKDVLDYVIDTEISEGVTKWDGMSEDRGAVGGTVGFIPQDVDDKHLNQIRELHEE